MFRKKNKQQAVPNGIVGDSLESVRLTKKEREEIANAERKRIDKEMQANADRYQIVRSTQRIIPVQDIYNGVKYSLQGTTQGNGLTGGVPPVRFSM